MRNGRDFRLFGRTSFGIASFAAIPYNTTECYFLLGVPHQHSNLRFTPHTGNAPFLLLRLEHFEITQISETNQPFSENTISSGTGVLAENPPADWRHRLHCRPVYVDSTEGYDEHSWVFPDNREKVLYFDYVSGNIGAYFVSNEEDINVFRITLPNSVRKHILVSKGVYYDMRMVGFGFMTNPDLAPELFWLYKMFVSSQRFMENVPGYGGARLLPNVVFRPEENAFP